MRTPHQSGISEPGNCVPLELRPVHGRIGVWPRETLEPGTVVLRLAGPLRTEPTRYSIQLGNHLHVDASGNLDDELNHSCDASARFDFENMVLVAKRRIEPADEITINYCATEDVLRTPFHCDCGSPRCYGFVRGFAFLAAAQRMELYDELSPYLKQRLDASQKGPRNAHPIRNADG